MPSSPARFARTAMREDPHALVSAIVDGARDAILLTDLDGTITSWNAGAEAVYGHEPARAVGRPLSLLLPAGRQPEAAEILASVRAGEAVDRFETEHVRADGETVWVSLSASPVHDVTGAVSGASIVAHDITAHVHSEQLFRAVIESAPDAMIVAGEDGAIQIVNRQTELLFGYERTELIGQPIEILVPDRFRARHAGHRDGYVADPRVRPMGAGHALFGRRRDGAEFPVEISLSPVRTPHGLAVAAAIRDVTQRKAVEEELQAHREHLEELVAERTRELRAINAELEAFSYSVSHDLRAPLRAVHGFADALAEDYGDRLDAEGRDHLRRVQAAAERMGELIDGLLGLSRVTRSELDHTAVDVSALVAEIAEELRAGRAGGGIEVVIEPGMVATGDPRLLRVAFQNLLANAFKFTEGRRHPRVEVGSAARGGDRSFFVRDNGAGFDMAFAGKLFGAFQRLHGADYPGSGIGLATVQRIAHRHGGRVWAEAAPDAGATFHLSLPA